MVSTRKGDTDMIEMTQYRDRQIEQQGHVAALQAQVAAMSNNVATMRLIANKLTDENSALAEALGQSTAARGKQADTIARLERENADLRRQVEALQGARRVALMLTDRDPWGDGCGYDVGQLAVMELRGAG